jgi:hypothetical protein
MSCPKLDNLKHKLGSSLIFSFKRKEKEEFYSRTNLFNIIIIIKINKGKVAFIYIAVKESNEGRNEKGK